MRLSFQRKSPDLNGINAGYDEEEPRALRPALLDPPQPEDDRPLVLLHHLNTAPDGEREGENDKDERDDGEQGGEEAATAVIVIVIVVVVLRLALDLIVNDVLVAAAPSAWWSLVFGGHFERFCCCWRCCWCRITEVPAMFYREND